MAQELDPTSLAAALAQVHASAIESALDALDRVAGLAISQRDPDGRLVYLNEGTRQIWQRRPNQSVVKSQISFADKVFAVLKLIEHEV